MAQATAQQVAEMDRVQGHVEALLVGAEKKAAAIEAKPSWFRTDLEDASLLAIRGGRSRFNTWIDGQDGLRRWAIDGRKLNGEAYSPEEWAQFGEELGGLMAEEAGFADKASYYTLLSQVTPGSFAEGAKALAGQARKAVGLDELLHLSFTTKLALGGVLGVVGLGALAWLASSTAPLLNAFAPRRQSK